MNNEPKKKEYGVVITGLVMMVLALPLILGMLIARGFISIIVNARHHKLQNKISLIVAGVSIVIYISVALALAFALGKPSQAKEIAWYDYLIPLATEIKIILRSLNDTSELATEISLAFVTSITFGALLTYPLYLFRPMAKRFYLEAIAMYEKKLQADEVVADPRKNVSVMSHLIFFMLVLDRKRIEKTTLELHQIVELNKNRVMLDDHYGIPRKYLDRHLAILGTTGSGKTETTFKFLEDSIKNDKPTIMVDGKGDVGNIFRLKALADKYNKPFKVFTLSGRELKDKGVVIQPSAYNPFSTDNEGILVDSIMSLFNYSEEHYKAGARVYMDLLIKSLLETKTSVSWDNIMLYLEKTKLVELLKQRYQIGANAPKVSKPVKQAKASTGKIVISVDTDVVTEAKASAPTIQEAKKRKAFSIDLQQIENIDHKSIAGFISRIGMFYNTTRETITEDGFTLEDVFKENGVVIFSLNSLDYQEQASAIGRLIVNNIKASAEINASLGKKTTIALDEFNVFADNNVIDILNKTRSKGYELILAFQSIADLKKVSDDFMLQVIENTNSKIIHRTNDPEGAEYLASVLGTSKTHKKTYVAEDEETTGKQSVRVVDTYIAHPNELKNLKVGEAFAKYTNEDGTLFTTPHKIKIKLD